MRDGEDGARDVHGVCAFRHVDDVALVDRRELVQDPFDGGEGGRMCQG